MIGARTMRPAGKYETVGVVDEDKRAGTLFVSLVGASFSPFWQPGTGEIQIDRELLKNSVSGTFHVRLVSARGRPDTLTVSGRFTTH